MGPVFQLLTSAGGDALGRTEPWGTAPTLQRREKATNPLLRPAKRHLSGPRPQEGVGRCFTVVSREHGTCDCYDPRASVVPKEQSSAPLNDVHACSAGRTGFRGRDGSSEGPVSEGTSVPEALAELCGFVPSLLGGLVSRSPLDITCLARTEPSSSRPSRTHVCCPPELSRQEAEAGRSPLGATARWPSPGLVCEQRVSSWHGGPWRGHLVWGLPRGVWDGQQSLVCAGDGTEMAAELGGGALRRSLVQPLLLPTRETSPMPGPVLGLGGLWAAPTQRRSSELLRGSVLAHGWDGRTHKWSAAPALDLSPTVSMGCGGAWSLPGL